MLAIHKRWLKRVAAFAQEHGSFPYGDDYNFQIHHVVGRTGKHNRIDIGHWFILPIDYQCHAVEGKDEFHVGNFRRKFCDKFGMQKELFFKMCEVIKSEDGELPFDDDVMSAIMGTRY